MYFSLPVERKVPKERHVRKGPRSFPYGSYPLSGAAFLPEGKKALCAVISRIASSPQPRRSAELAGQTWSRGCAKNFLFLLRILGDFRADGAPPFVRGIGCPRPSAQSDSFATPMAKGSRGDGGFLKGGLHASLKWRFFWYFSFATERKVHNPISPINPNLKRYTKKPPKPLDCWRI